ncbi:MAG: polyribonucleotide nucleotidyltransferase, partial [Schwartzia sp.]|nr:polyribonucleotide nucleotidyltransferase [Schwartzia sp. (in: firmicutes)]
VVLEAILFGHKEIQRIVEFQRDIMAACGKEKREMKLFEIPEALEKGIREYAAERLDKAVRNPDKLQRDEDIAVVNADTMEHFLVEYPDNAKEIAQVLHDVEKDIVRHMITHEKIRPDGRALDEVRPVSCEVGILPRAHGSGLFTRGQTQILTVTTLGSLSDEQVLDGLGTEKSKRYIHQYNFPGYSVGEARPIRSPGRREIGHGALAERALVPVIPSEEEFPYTLRLVSEVLESNGSSSMGSVCGSTLSLMHAGVPIKRPVAGVAMGLVKEGDEYTILTDIQGMEDALGDMDFKVAGTEVGVTAIQMDIKIAGITREILSSALAQAKRGREFIMGKMMECISEPAADLSPYAPRVTTMHIKTDKIRTVIGPGGKMIKKIVDETGTQIDIEEDGTIRISATDQDAAKKAVAIIEDLVREVEVGAVYKGRVTRTMTFGAFVEVLPGKEGLCHISQLAKERVEKVEDVVNVGDELEVKVTEIDRQGRVNLSHKVLL